MKRGRPKIERTPSEEAHHKAEQKQRNAERAKQRRLEQTQEQKNAENERQRLRRQQLSEAKRATRAETDRIRMAAQRALQSETERVEKNAEQRERTLNRRSNFNDQQARAEAATARLRMQLRRNRVTKLCAAGFEIDDNDVAHYGGLLNSICTHCGAKHFESEKVSNKGLSFYSCCQHGTIHDTLKDMISNYPDELKPLFDLAEFRKDIRVLNNAHSFGSFNADVVNFGINRPGPYAFVVQGKAYYQINTALQNEPEQPKSHGQLYILDL